MACSQQASDHDPKSHPHLTPRIVTGPISESDFFTWEALICGPKDTPFVRPSLIT